MDDDGDAISRSMVSFFCLGNSWTQVSQKFCLFSGTKPDFKNDILLSHSFKVGDIQVLQNYLQQDVLDVPTKDYVEKSVNYISFDQQGECSELTCK